MAVLTLCHDFKGGGGSLSTPEMSKNDLMTYHESWLDYSLFRLSYKSGIFNQWVARNILVGRGR